MARHVGRAAVATALALGIHAAPASAVTREQFVVRTSADLATLCSVQEGDPHYEAAIGFCHGFMVGAYRYHEATVGASEAPKWFCLPDPAPARAQIIERWLAWVKADPARLAAPAVESPFRFLADAWPCPPAADGVKKGGSR